MSLSRMTVTLICPSRPASVFVEENSPNPLANVTKDAIMMENGKECGHGMRRLFTIDTQDYHLGGTIVSRPSVRGIIIREERLAMIHSRQYNYYKFPGGGMEPGENPLDTLIREVREESGLCVLRDTVRPFGYVHRIQKGYPEDVFVQDNYYYLCQAAPTMVSQQLDAYEQEEGFTLAWVRPSTVLQTNRNTLHTMTREEGFQWNIVLQRECRVIEQLLAEGYIANQ